MKLSYYPGCSLHGTASDYNGSVKEVCATLGIDLVEIPDWNCCGASSAHMTSHELGIRLPLRNLLLAEELGNDILVPCAACFQRLKAAEKAVKADPSFWDIAGETPQSRILHISSLLSRQKLLYEIEQRARIQLEGLKVACYYGCLSLRNPAITDMHDHEQPCHLEMQMQAVGATPVSWSHRTECCSGSLTMTRPDIAIQLVGDIVDAAIRAGADALVTDCPMCQANVESRQLGRDRSLPVFYATEVIQAALTGNYPTPRQRGHLVPAEVLPQTVHSAILRQEEIA